jgi:hypothetical protein
MDFQMRCQRIFSFFQQTPNGTVRAAASATGMSKSAAHRHKQALARRNLYPESWFWETAAGRQWLGLLVCATIYVFGIRGGVGMDMMAEFFLYLHVSTHLGVSASSLARITAQIENAILAYPTQPSRQSTTPIAVVLGADEVFFDSVFLVMMEMCSGFLFLETRAEDRTFLTWQAQAQQALAQVNVKIKYLVSDQAKALVKLALDGLHCDKIPDLFHALHEVVKLFGGRFARKLATLQRQIAQGHLRLDTLRQREASPEYIARQEQQLADLRAAHTTWLQGQDRYYEALHALSLRMHPFAVETLRPQTTDDVATAMTTTVTTLRSLAEAYDIADSKHRLKKVQKQVPDIAALVDLWWLWIRESLAVYALPPDLEAWLLEVLLPSVYWDLQRRRTTSGLLQHTYAEAAKHASARLEAHPLTQILASKELTRWRSWATWMAMKFQRTSSAVEGRNGLLARMNHTQRSIPVRRLQVATVIHNFGIYREDGTTAAERLFGEPFPDLFDWIVEHVRELPPPRHRMVAAL